MKEDGLTFIQKYTQTVISQIPIPLVNFPFRVAQLRDARARGGKLVLIFFNPGDIGYVNRNNGHYIKNVGDTDLQYLEVFRISYYADVSLSDWLTHIPPSLVAQHLNINEATIAKFPNNRPLVMPE